MNSLTRIFLASSLYIASIALAVFITAGAVEALYEAKEAKLESTMQYIMQQNVSLKAELAQSQEILEGINLKPLGEFEVTHYDISTGTGTGITASGTRVKEGRTCAVNREQIPLGSLIYIENVGFRIAEDVGGGIETNELDLYVESKAECIRLGRVNRKVWIIESEGK